MINEYFLFFSYITYVKFGCNINESIYGIKRGVIANHQKEEIVARVTRQMKSFLCKLLPEAAAHKCSTK